MRERGAAAKETKEQRPEQGRRAAAEPEAVTGVGNRAIVQRMTGAGAGAESTPRPPGMRGLPPALRAGLEGLSGISLGDASVRYDSPAPARVGALATTQGSTIHLGPRQERHLAHEAWHVVQQKQGRVAATGSIAGVAVNSDRRLEREASRMGAEAARLGHAAPQRALSERPALGRVAQRIEANQDTDGNWISQIAPGRAMDDGEGYIRVTNFASIADTTFGSLGSRDHAYVGIEYVDNNVPATIFTDLTHDGVRIYDTVNVFTGGITVADTNGLQTRTILASKMGRGYSGTTYRVTAGAAQAAEAKARQVAAGYFGTRPPTGSTPTYKFAKSGWAMSTDHYTNCARFAHKLLKSAGIDVSPGWVAKTPYEVANVKDSSKLESVLDATGGVDVKEMTKSLKDLESKSSFAERHGPTGRRTARLTDDEIVAIKAWTDGIGGPMASFLRGSLTEDLADISSVSHTKRSMQAVIDALNSGLDKLPDHPGKSYRKSGIADDAVFRTRIKPGDYVMDRSFLATATVRGVSSIGAWGTPGSAWFEIRGLTGKSISPYSGLPKEREVLFRAGTTFKVNAVKIGAGRTAFVIMTEEAPPTATTPIKSTFDGRVYPPPPTVAPTLTTTAPTTTTTDTTTDTTTATTTTTAPTSDTGPTLEYGTDTESGPSSLLPTTDPSALVSILKTLVEDETTTAPTTVIEDTEDLEDESIGYMPILGYQKSTEL